MKRGRDRVGGGGGIEIGGKEARRDEAEVGKGRETEKD